jgi:hypothetical protein
VIARSNIGRFISQCEEAATATVKDAIKEGARLSKEFAPHGSKPDPRTKTIRDSIDHRMTGATRGEWYADARHALPQETGAAPHDITGYVSFFWEKEGRDWEPGPNTIHHPGNAPQPYLRPAYEIVMSRVMEIAKRHYPG